MSAEVRVTRLRSIGGMLRRWPVEIDGRTIDTLRRRGTSSFPVAAGRHVIRVGGKPSEGLQLDLDEDDFVEVEARGRQGDGYGRMHPIVSVARMGPMHRRPQ